MVDKTRLTGSLYKDVTSLCGTLPAQVTRIETYKSAAQLVVAVTTSTGTFYVKAKGGLVEVDTANDEWGSGTRLNLSA